MAYFDLLAYPDFKVPDGHWLLAASLKKKEINSTGKLTDARIEFLKQHGIEGTPKKNSHKVESIQGKAKQLSCHKRLPKILDTADRDHQEALKYMPRYSARLLLEFKLSTPLLTKDDDPFYLFDNPVRKDHIFGMPHLSAASVKGLSVDAYQRAFPSKNPIANEKETDRICKFRAQDESAKHLFGIADNGTNTHPNQVGRLHFSPIWFNKVQFLIMNPQDKETAKGNIPIQFEAIAPGQTGILEVIYFNPAGIKDSDEDTVRYDLARWLASIATWWPEFGLGAKRLAGYGAIEIQDATLQAVDWSNMLETNEEKIASQEPQLEKPDRYEKYLDENSELLSQEAFDTALQTKMVKKETEIATLQTQWNKEQRGKQKKKIKKILDSATNKKNTLEELEKSQYKKADDYWQQSHVDIHQTTEEPADIKKELPIEERTERGEDSWIKLARWIAGEKD